MQGAYSPVGEGQANKILVCLVLKEDSRKETETVFNLFLVENQREVALEAITSS